MEAVSLLQLQFQKQMYSLNIKRQKDLQNQAALKQSRIDTALQEKRIRLSLDARKRMNSWLQTVEQSDVQAICQGAKNKSVAKGQQAQDNEKSILKGTDQGTFFNRIYLRKYEPDEIRRYKQRSGLSESYLDVHLDQEGYKGNPNELFKSLLKPRTRSNERHFSMNFQQKSKVQHKENSSMVDASAKDMSLYYKPDFRSIGTSYKTIGSPSDKEKEKGFKVLIGLEKENTKLNKTVLNDPLKRENGIKEQFIEGFEYLAKGMERTRDKRFDIANQEFVVNTSSMNAPLFYQQTYESSSLRQLEASMMDASHVPSITMIKPPVFIQPRKNKENINSLNSSLMLNSSNQRESLNVSAISRGLQNASPLNNSISEVIQEFREPSRGTTVLKKSQGPTFDTLNYKPALQPSISLIKGQPFKSTYDRTKMPGANKVYFKSIELSSSYHDLKQRQKNRVKEELQQMKSMISQEFDRLYYMQSQGGVGGASTTQSKVIRPVQYGGARKIGDRSSMSSFTPYQQQQALDGPSMNRCISQNQQVSVEIQRIQSALSRLSSPTHSQGKGARNQHAKNATSAFTPARTPSRCGSRGGQRPQSIEPKDLIESKPNTANQRQRLKSAIGSHRKGAGFADL